MCRDHSCLTPVSTIDSYCKVWNFTQKEKKGGSASFVSVAAFEKKVRYDPLFWAFLGAPQRLVILAHPLTKIFLWKWGYECYVWILPEYIRWSNKAIFIIIWRMWKEMFCSRVGCVKIGCCTFSCIFYSGK